MCSLLLVLGYVGVGAGIVGITLAAVAGYRREPFGPRARPERCDRG